MSGDEHQEDNVGPGGHAAEGPPAEGIRCSGGEKRPLLKGMAAWKLIGNR